MVEQLTEVDVEKVRGNLAEINAKIAAAAVVAGRDPGEIEVVAATKYIAASALGALAEAGVNAVGENRQQDLANKQELWGDRFTWDFIGDLQSRKVPSLAGTVRFIHSVGTESALAKLDRPGLSDQRILIQVNISGEESKSGIAPDQLGAFIESSAAPVVGLMTMPPLAASPSDSRRFFSELRELAERHGLQELSMGTSQDFEIAVEEGATLVRIGSVLCR